MTILDYIDLSDDEDILKDSRSYARDYDIQQGMETIDLSSDEETAKEDCNAATQDHAAENQTTFHGGQALFVVAGECRQEALEFTTTMEATASNSVAEKASGDTVASENFFQQSPTAAPIRSGDCAVASQALTHSPTSSSCKALNSETCGAKLHRVKGKHVKKLRPVSPWKSPRLVVKHKGRNKSMEDLAVDLKTSRMLVKQSVSVRRQQKNKLFST